jgi:hypothetical protein
MIRKFFTVALASLAIAAPASAQLMHNNGDAWIIKDGNGSTHFFEIMHHTKEGYRFIETNVIHSNGSIDTGSLYIDCSDDTVNYVGRADWEAIDHRNAIGWYSDAACRR